MSRRQYISRVTPNEDQEKALEAMRAFIKDKTKNEFCLDGAGGTGKTTIIKELFATEEKEMMTKREIKKKEMNGEKVRGKKKPTGRFYIPSNVIGVTVSHKARLVLSEHIPNSITYAAATNMTIDFDPWGEMIFIPKNGNFTQSKLFGYKYIIFDEASMVSEEMRQILHLSCSPNAKIIYLGDHCQLPPIKPKNGSYDPNSDSPVFDLPDRYTLTQKVRQVEGDHIAELCDTTRTYIDSDFSLEWMSKLKQKYDKEKGKGYSFSNEDAVIKSFVNNYNNGINCRIVAYRNARVDYLNTKVRMMIFGEDSDYPYLRGDLIIGNDMYNPTNEMEPIFFNGEDMIIDGINDNIVEDIRCHEIWMKGKNLPIYVVKEIDKAVYDERIYTLKSAALRSKIWNEYMSFKNKFANISYGYVITLYKIQGTTLYGAYVDTHDIFGVKPLTDKRKLQALYVGFSRPTNFLALF